MHKKIECISAFRTNKSQLKIQLFEEFFNFSSLQCPNMNDWWLIGSFNGWKMNESSGGDAGALRISQIHFKEDNNKLNQLCFIKHIELSSAKATVNFSREISILNDLTEKSDFLDLSPLVTEFFRFYQRKTDINRKLDCLSGQ